MVAYTVEDGEGQQSSSISKIALSTGTVSNLSQGIGRLIEYMINYKENKIVLFAKDFKSTEKFAFLLDYTTGTFKSVAQKCVFSLGDIKEGFYVPDYDIIVYSSNLSSKDIVFMKIDETDSDNPQLYGYDSKYTYDYENDYPHRLFSVNPLEVITGAGDIFTIDVDYIDSIEPIDEYPSGKQYHEKMIDWCIWNRNIGFTYDDFIACGDYFYIMKIDKKDAYYKNNTIVEKRSFAEPGTIINTVTFEEENGIRLWKSGQKLYVQTTEWGFPSGTYNAQDMIIFHEIDF